MRTVVAAVLAATTVACGGSAPEPPPPVIEQSSRSADAELLLRISRNPTPVTNPVVVDLEIRLPESHQARFPDEIAPAGEWLANDSRTDPPRLLNDGRIAVVHRYELEPLGPGEIEIPPIEVEYSSPDSPDEVQSLSTEPVSVTVEAVYGDAEEPTELVDIRGPVEAPIPWWWWAIGALAAAALGYAVYRWRQSRNADSPEPEAALPPPHIAALQAIDRLLADRLPEKGEHKLFYGLLSNILRRYVEDRYGIRAPERTTEEFLIELRSGDALGPTHQALLKMFLEHADLVKFAELEPAPEQAEESAEVCRRFIRETAPPPPEPSAGS